MNIDRNNYEEYFLLYADNELSDSEKAEVLIFLKQNKDLEEEFRMIHHTICKPDISVELADKSFLLMGSEKPLINEKNYEEVFVLYHDNELTDKQKRETEEFLFHHAPLKKEFELIGLAKLIPDDSVMFRNKKSLYKKEKTGKVIPVIFWRILAAAVFIGFGLWVIQVSIQKGGEKAAIAIQSIPVKQTAPVTRKNELREKKPLPTIVQSPARNSRPSRTGIIHAKEKPKNSLSPVDTNMSILVKSSEKVQKTGDENLMNLSPEKINDEVVLANQDIKKISNKQIARDNTIGSTGQLAQNPIQSNERVQPVAYTQTVSFVSAANDKDQNYVFYDITTDEFRKTKVSSFLKKVKRVIKRNNPISRLLSGDEDQVLSN